MVCTYSLHRDPRLWERPDQLELKRFLKGDQVWESRFYYLPFGAGKHRCVGKRVALFLLTLFLEKLTASFWFFPLKAATPYPRVALRPEPGLFLKLVPRG